jgi:predicted DNA-binding transcriptional regulator YafY
MAASEVVQRQARVLRLLSYLQSGVGLNADELAEQLDVCRRTVYRDLKLIREAGIDVYRDSQQNCYRISSDSDVVLSPSFTPDDLATLIAAIHLSVLAELPCLGDSLRKSIAKLLSRAPRPVGHSVSRLVNSFVVQTPIRNYSPDAIRALLAFLQAIQHRQVVRLTYAGSTAGVPVRTRFAPYRLIVSSEKWQVAGKSTFHRGVHTFDPREIRSVELTRENYAIPRHFSATG